MKPLYYPLLTEPTEYQKKIKEINEQIIKATNENLKNAGIGITIGAAIRYGCRVLIPYGP